jgi:predicted amidohydrolase
MRIAACRMNSRQDKMADLDTALALLAQAAARAGLAVLPEPVDRRGTVAGALEAAELVPGRFVESLAAGARRPGLPVLAG